MVTIFIDTLGCAKNQVDSEELATKLSKCGYSVVYEPNRADIIIVNTCGFIESAKSEAIDTLLYYRNTYPQKKIIAA
ncbi:MAG TPA: 30S ribosomal protein S12 methylthiotransferase RimO, partial [Spirochaetales bacterium]|nr:30S ribosomal protein S12 methylthiotransferase RimO [Spirochaetales bacterium]